MRPLGALGFAGVYRNRVRSLGAVGLNENYSGRLEKYKRWVGNMDKMEGGYNYRMDSVRLFGRRDAERGKKGNTDPGYEYYITMVKGEPF